jgi:hypothetical protein
LPGTTVGVTLAALAVPAVATSAIVLKTTAINQSVTNKSGFLFRVLPTLYFPLISSMLLVPDRNV